MIRMTVRLVLLAAAFFCMEGLVCSTVVTTDMLLHNPGLDPVHINGHRVGQNQTGSIETVRNGNGFSMHMSREDINFGYLCVSQKNDDQTEPFVVTVTMTKPTCFHFSSDSPDSEVSYHRP